MSERPGVWGVQPLSMMSFTVQLRSLSGVIVSHYSLEVDIYHDENRCADYDSASDK
jgi:hypothetical protein